MSRTLQHEGNEDVFLGAPQRFADGKAEASYVGLLPGERSSGRRPRGVHVVRRDPDLQRFYRRKLVQKGLGKARVAVARKLGIRLCILLRDQID